MAVSVSEDGRQSAVTIAVLTVKALRQSPVLAISAWYSCQDTVPGSTSL